MERNERDVPTRSREKQPYPFRGSRGDIKTRPTPKFSAPIVTNHACMHICASMGWVVGSCAMFGRGNGAYWNGSSCVVRAIAKARVVVGDFLLVF